MRNALLLLLLLFAPGASAADLLERTLTVQDGLPGTWVTALAQSPDGTLWLGGPTGLVRWDGTQATAFGTGTIGHFVSRIGIGGDRVIAVEAHGVAWELVGDEVLPVTGPDGERLRLRDGWLDADGVFHALSDGVLWSQDPTGRWEVGLAGSVAEELVRLDRGPDGSLLLGGRTGWWTWRPGEHPEFLVEGTGAIQGLVDDDGGIWLSDRKPVRVRRRRDGVWSEVWRATSVQNFGFTVRDGTLWTGMAGKVWAVADDGKTELFGRDGAWMRAMGPWLTDADGSVWAGGFQGAVQLPEPDLRLWGVPQGLPSSQIRSLVVRHRDVFVGTWGGYRRIALDAIDDVSAPTRLLGKGLVCQDAAGVGWSRAQTEDRQDRYVAVLPHGSAKHLPAPRGTHFLYGCAPAGSGDVWFAAWGRIERTRGPDEPPKDFGAVPIPAKRNHRVLEDREHRLWVTGDRTVCMAPVADVEAGTPSWTCHAVPADVHLDDIHQTDAGTIWVVERTVGVLRLGASGFEPIPAASTLPTHNLKALSGSPRGGTWVLGAMAPMRVLDRPDTSMGWEVVERLPDWMGSLFSAVKDLVELPDGTLWLATHAGVVRIPPQARDELPTAPPVRISEVRIDGELADPGQTTFTSGSQLTVRTSSGTLLHPRQVRYRHRVDDGAWSVPTPIPGVQLASLTTGMHRLEVAASYDQRTWSEPAAFAYEVWSPWWQRPWVWGVGLALLGVLLAMALQVRASLRLREERLRIRVAMDLHDEIGAGLASIGLLAGLAGDRHVAEDRARGLAEQIAHDAEDLGASVSGIVWSLRPGHATAGALADFIEARARSLLPHLEAAGDLWIERESSLDGLGTLDLDVLRAVQLVVLEALHNVSKHAAATEVRIELSRRGSQLVVRVLDDGIGFDPDAIHTAPDRGLGLRSMSERMRAAGGACTVRERPEGGTEVHLRVPPRKRRRWWPR